MCIFQRKVCDARSAMPVPVVRVVPDLTVPRAVLEKRTGQAVPVSLVVRVLSGKVDQLLVFPRYVQGHCSFYWHFIL